MARAASSVIRNANPEVAVFDVRTMEDRISQTVTQPRFQAAIVTFFAAAALFLAGIGIFAVVAHSTAQRTQEIGIRMVRRGSRQEWWRPSSPTLCGRSISESCWVSPERWP